MSALDDAIAGLQSGGPGLPPPRRRHAFMDLEDDGGELDDILASAGVPPKSTIPPHSPSSSFVESQAGEKSALARAWDTVTRPIKTVVGATQGAVPRLLFGGTDAYQRAAEEKSQGDFGRGRGDLSTLEALEAAPGLGDLAAQVIPDEIKNSWAGTALGGIGRLAGNIAGDPTTYLGGVGALTKVGKLTKLAEAGSALAKGEQIAPKIAAALEAAGGVQGVARGLVKATSEQSRGSSLLNFLSSTQQTGEVGRGIRQLLKGEPLGAARAGLALPTSAYTGLAYAPDIAEGIARGGQRTLASAQQGDVSGATASGVDTLLQTGLAALVGRGLIHERQAIRSMRDAAAEKQQQMGTGAATEEPAAPAGPAQPGANRGGPGLPPPEPLPGFGEEHPLDIGRPPSPIDLSSAPQPLGPRTRWVMSPDGEVIQEVVIPPAPEAVMRPAAAPPVGPGLPPPEGIGALPEPQPLDLSGQPRPTPPPQMVEGLPLVEEGVSPLVEAQAAPPALSEGLPPRAETELPGGPDQGYPKGQSVEIPPRPGEGGQPADIGGAMDEVLRRRRLEQQIEQAVEGALGPAAEPRLGPGQRQAAPVEAQAPAPEHPAPAAEGRSSHVPPASPEALAKLREETERSLSYRDGAPGPAEPPPSLPPPAPSVWYVGDPIAKGGKQFFIHELDAEGQPSILGKKPPAPEGVAAEPQTNAAATPPPAAAPQPKLSPGEFKFTPEEWAKVREGVELLHKNGLSPAEIYDTLHKAGVPISKRALHGIVQPLIRAKPTITGDLESLLRQSLEPKAPKAPAAEEAAPPAPQTGNIEQRFAQTRLETGDRALDDLITQAHEKAATEPATLPSAETPAQPTGEPTLAPTEPASAAPPSHDEIWQRLNQAREEVVRKPLLVHGIPLDRSQVEDLASTALVTLGEKATTGKLDPKYMQHFEGPSSPEKIAKLRGLIVKEIKFNAMDAHEAESIRPTTSLDAPLGGEGSTTTRGALIPDESPAGRVASIADTSDELAQSLGKRTQMTAADIRTRVAAMAESDLTPVQQLAELSNMSAANPKPFGGQTDPRLVLAKQIAQDLGIDLGKARPSLQSIITKVLTHLNEQAGSEAYTTRFDAAVKSDRVRRVKAVLTDAEGDKLQFKTTLGVDEAGLQARSEQWSQAIDEGVSIPDSQLRVVDLEGDGPEVTAALGAATREVAPVLDRIQAELAQRFGWNGDLAGLTAAGPIAGVRVGDRMVLNPVEAWSNTSRAHGLEGKRYAAAENLLDTLIHENLHAEYGHGPQFDQAYADTLRSLSERYVSMTRHIERSLDHEALEAMRPAWETRRDSYLNGERSAGPEPGAQGDVAGAVPRPGAEGVADGAGALRAGPSVSEAGGGPGASVSAGPEGRPAPRVIRPIADTDRGPAARDAGLRTADRPGAPVGGGGEAGARGGPSGGGAAAEGARVQASLTPVLAEQVKTAEARKTTEATVLRYLSRYQETMGDDPQARAMLDEVRQALQTAPEATIKKLAEYGPGPRKKGDIALSVERLFPDMDERKRAEAAVILAVQNHLLDRSKPLTFSMLDGEARKAFELDSPEAFMKAKAAGRLPRKVADVVAFKQLVGMYDHDVDTSYADLRATAHMPEGPAKGDAVDSASSRLAQAQMAKLHALYGLANTGTFFGRGLATMRYIARPLTPGETFQGRLVGGLKRAGVKKGVADGLWNLYEGEAKKGAGGDWATVEDAFAKALQPRWSDKVLEFWKAGLLGWPTQVANTASNVMFFGLRNLEESIVSLVREGPVGGAHEIAGRFMGMRRALGDLAGGDEFESLGPALRDALLAKRPDLRNQLERGSRFDEFSAGDIRGAIGGNDTSGPIAKRFGEFVRTPFKLLSTADNAFKHLSRTQLLGQEAMRLAQDLGERRDGESVPHAGARIFNEMLQVQQNKSGNPELFSKYKKIFTKAHQQMNRDTFQAPTGPVAEAIRNLAAKKTAAGFATNIIIPFVKTPSNVIKEALYRTPLGIVKALHDWKTGKLEGAELISELVKAGLGTTVMLATLHAALDGSITGAGPTDPKQSELLKESGWQPYSFKLPGDHYISYQRLEPLSSTLGIAADIAEGIKRGEFSNWQDGVKRLAGSVTENITNKTFLSGLEGAVSVLNDPFRNGPTFIKQLEASLVPNIIGTLPIGGAARALDPTFRQTEVGLGPLAAKIPGLSQMLPAQRTPLGEERVRPGSWFERLVSPLVRSEEKQGPVADVARELDRIGYAPQAVPAYGTFSGQRVYFTRDEQEGIAKAERRGVEALDQIIKAPGFQALPDKESLSTQGQKTKEDVVRAVLRAFRTPVVQQVNRRALSRAKEGVFRPEPLLGPSGAGVSQGA